ncbi:hypothetical protein BIW11_08434 [Tropilaelaps mercedesae]|uniref:LSM domain-containing protein n=1 Tax=Tropilaelaps mercedesae TaxID=418985 RepID=A0A1V9XPK7_9ACAR|nr:hypothetical protein BIW11_08434 [Tropilaelaps mercedesae]
MTEEQDLTKPIADPILLLIEGTAKLPPSSSDLAPLDSLEEFDRVCTIDVRAKLPKRDREKIEKDRLLKEQRNAQAEHTEKVVKRKKQNVLTRINNQWSSGPISILHRALSNRLRVRVWIRSHTTVRSILVGFVAAFDKHLNLALVDVDEVVILRPATIKCTTLSPADKLANIEAKCNEQEFLVPTHSVGSEEIAITDFGSDAATEVETMSISGDLAKDILAEAKDGNDAALTALPESIYLNQEHVTTSLGSDSNTLKLVKPSQKSRRRRQQMDVTSDAQKFIPQLFVRGESVAIIAFADVHDNDNEVHTNSTTTTST